MAEHTLGPWELQEFGVYPSDGPTKYRIVDSDGVTVGFTYGYSRQDWLNGLVMKAAPDLLAALDNLVKFTAGMDGDVYGPFCGGDPRLFKPDEEVCTAGEIANWRDACRQWDEENGDDRGPGCATMGDGSAWTGGGFGIGITTIRIPEIDAARAAIAKARGEQ